jgi:hypothetical protein
MVTDHLAGAGLSPTDLSKLRAQFRALVRPLSDAQVLDLADLLHEMIRERRVEERSWERVHSRGAF